MKGYDEPEILPSQLSRFCLIGADAGQPADVAETIQRDCKQRWPNSAFDAGACVDQEAEVWLEAQQKGELPKSQPSTPDLLGKSPDLLIRPKSEDDQ